MNSKIPLIITSICLAAVTIFCIFMVVSAFNSGSGPEATPQVIYVTPTPEATPEVTGEIPGESETPAVTGDATAQPTQDPSVDYTPAPKGQLRTDIKAIYCGNMVGKTDFLNKVINWCKTTELNAVVVDIKEVDGHVYYNSNIPVIKNNNFIENSYDAKSVLSQLHAAGVYVIGRISTFKDGCGATLDNYKMAVIKDDGTVYKESSGAGSSTSYAWFNPFLQETWDYNINIALEAVDLGFDEIQFDYVRFPTVSADYGTYSRVNGDAMTAITGFVERAYQKITYEKGVPISMDVFGGIYETQAGKEDQLWLGQNPLMFSNHISFVCPMVYPSHYANASRGTMGNGIGSVINGRSFTAPDLYPYDVVKCAMASVKLYHSQLTQEAPVCRPYLQAFTASYLSSGYWMEYTAEQVRKQIQAVYDSGLTSWTLWDASYNYKTEYFVTIE